MVLIRLLFTFLLLIGYFIPSLCQELGTINKFRRHKLANEFYEKGMSYYENDRLPEAIENFESSVSLDPNNHLAYYFLGSSYEKTADLEKALLNYNLTLALKPDFLEGLFSRAVLYFQLARYEHATKDFKHLLELPESETQAVYFRGIQYGEKDTDVGFDQLITMSTREADIHNYLGHCYSKIGKLDLAVSHFSIAIEINPDQDFCYVNRGTIYMDMGRTDSARSDFEMALKINPNNSLAGYNLSILDPREDTLSFHRISDIIKKNPKLPFAYAARAYYHYRQGNYKSAVLDYDSAIFLDADNHTYYLERGMCYEKMNRYEDTFRNYKMASLLNPGDPDVWFNLGNIYYKEEKYDEAIEAYTTSLELDNTIGSCYYNRGLTFHEKGDIDKACDDMKIALNYKIEPAKNFLGKYCSR